MTEYTVLAGNATGTEWLVVATVKANSAEQAIRKAVASPGTMHNGIYAAPPSRSLKPFNVAVETPAPVIRLHAAKEPVKPTLLPAA